MPDEGRMTAFAGRDYVNRHCHAERLLGQKVRGQRRRGRPQLNSCAKEKIAAVSRTRLLAVNKLLMAAVWIFIFIPPTPMAPVGQNSGAVFGVVHHIDPFNSRGADGIQVDGQLECGDRSQLFR